MQIDYCDLVFAARALAAGKLPPYHGQTIRGALGLALRRLVCHAHGSDCERCILRQRCAYAVGFEGVPPHDRLVMRKYPRIPQPFVLRVEPAGPGMIEVGAPFSFGLRLFGPAVDLHPYFVQAVRDLLSRGLGRDRIPMELQDVSDGDAVIYRPASPMLKPPALRHLHLPPASTGAIREIEIECITPLRLQVDGQVAASLRLGPFLKAVVRRAKTMGAFYGQGPVVETPRELLDAADSAELVSGSLKPCQVRRFSGRQQRKLVLEGLVGKAAFRWPAGAADPRPWLEAASVLHVGKATTFGFGRIEYRTSGDGHDT